MLLSDHKASQLSKQLSQQTEDSSNGSGNGTLGSRFTPRLRAFTDIAGYSGVSQKLREKQFYICINFLSPKKQQINFFVQVFVCGSHPHWLTMTQRGTLTFHPMFIDGPVMSFAPFNNVNCPHGFLYFNAEVSLPFSLSLSLSLSLFLFLSTKVRTVFQRSLDDTKFALCHKNYCRVSFEFVSFPPTSLMMPPGLSVRSPQRPRPTLSLST